MSNISVRRELTIEAEQVILALREHGFDIPLDARVESLQWNKLTISWSRQEPAKVVYSKGMS